MWEVGRESTKLKAYCKLKGTGFKHEEYLNVNIPIQNK